MANLTVDSRQGSDPTATEILELIDRGVSSAETVIEACLAHIAEDDPQVRAFVDVRAQEAREAAKNADRTPHEKRGPLHGLPVAVKEIFDVAGMRCRWGSELHDDRVPEEDAVAVKRLKEAGAIVVGTVVSTEYAIAAAGPTRNPHDLTRTPGGSSSGPAAAVASGMVPVALGSQTVGSTVRPAAYCGVFGLKPTRGAIPGRGAMVLSPRLDHPGLFARTQQDLLLLCRVLFGAEKDDPTSIEIAPPSIPPDIAAMRVFAVSDLFPETVSAASRQAVARALERLERAGASIEAISLPQGYGRVVEVLYTIMTHDMALAHGSDRDRAGDRMSEHLRELIDQGRRVTSAQYSEAVGTAENWRAELDELLGDNAVMLSAATDDVAPLARTGTGSNRPQALWTLVGLPVMAIPCGRHEGLPVGVQAGAGTGCEGNIFALANAIAGQERFS